MSSDELVIRLEGVGKEYPRFATRKELLWNLLFPFRFKSQRFTALSPLDLNIRRGECVGVMGVNGSGKSTLLQIIAGTLYPTSGRVFVDGRVASLLELMEKSHQKRRRCVVALLPRSIATPCREAIRCGKAAKGSS